MTDQLMHESGYFDVSGTRLYYESAGHGPALVLIHAGIADARMWDAQLPALAPLFRTIRYDVRGYGRSPHAPGEFRFHDDLCGLLDALDVARASVVGCSFGGRIALDFALAYPQMVERLVLVNSALGGWQWSAVMQATDEAEERAIERGDQAAAAEINLRAWVDGPQRTPEQVDPAVRALVRELVLPTLLPSAAEGRPLPLDPPASGRLGEVRVPTLVIAGALDQPDILAIAEKLVAEIPDARLAVIEGGAHMVNMERPEQFNRLLLEFLRDAPP